jgi:hypothetical protein
VSRVAEHPSIEQLLAYWLDDVDAATIDAIDAHLMQCDDCGQALDAVLALGDAVREALRAGEVKMMASDAFVQRLQARGLKVREYRLPHNGSVDCTVAPDDQLLVARLEAPLHGVEQLDLLVQLSTEPGVRQHLHDEPFDPQAGAVLHIANLADVRRLPAHTMQLTLLAAAPGDTREVGRYTFNHRPWGQ